MRWPTRVADSSVEVITDSVAAAPAPPLPAITYEERPDGIRQARLDVERLTAWCRAVSLPLPPLIEECEAAVAEGLTEALAEAAANRTAATLGRLGQICESLEGHRSAEEYFRLAAKADPADFRWPYYLGCIAQVTGRNQEAEDLFTRARELNPSYATTYARLAQLYLELGRDADAARASQQYTTVMPNDWLGFVGLGRVALNQGDYSAAERYLKEAVQRGRQDFQAHYYLGKTYAALGQEDKAREHFAISAKLPRGEWFHHRDPLDQALHRSIDSTAALTDQMKALMHSKEWARLASLAERILERRPNDVDMMCNLSSFYRKLGRMDDAHRLLERAAEAAPQGADPLRRRAEVYLAQNKPAEALACMREAQTFAPPDAASWAVEGRCLLLLGRHAEAEKSMRRSLELAPDHPGNLYVLGEALRAQSRAQDAAACYRRVLELNPQDAHAARRLAELEGANP